jgi:hypothetical protein
MTIWIAAEASFCKSNWVWRMGKIRAPRCFPTLSAEPQRLEFAFDRLEFKASEAIGCIPPRL